MRRVVVRNRRALTVGTVLVSIHQLAETMVPISIGVIIDRAVVTGNTSALLWSIAGLAVLFVILTSAWRMGARFTVNAMQSEAHALRVEVAGRILDPRGVRTGLRSGELLTVSTSDADHASWICDVVARSAAALTAAIGSAVALLFIDVPLGLAVLIGTPVILGLLQLSAPLITRRATDQQSAIARVSAMATDLVSGLRPLRGIGAESAASARYRGASDRALDATLHTAKSTGLYTGVATTVSALLAVAVGGLGGWFALQGRITIGELVTVVGLSQFFIEPLGMLARMPGVIAVSRGSADRLALVLDAPSLLPESAGGELEGTELHVSDVHYRSLRGLELSAAPGELLGVLAYRPQDAEALVAVLSGQIPPDRYAGAVTVGGARIEDAGLVRVRRTMLVEPHNADLFSGSIGANVTAANRLAPREHVHRALEASATDDVIAAHPAGLDHEVTDRGASLSGGQRQRVALARALLATSPILVLHDPTTAVDAVTEHDIARGIAAVRHGGDTTAGQTTILVTSSPALLSVTDRIVVMDDGVQAAEGTHSSLLESDENYRKAVLR